MFRRTVADETFGVEIRAISTIAKRENFRRRKVPQKERLFPNLAPLLRREVGSHRRYDPGEGVSHRRRRKRMEPLTPPLSPQERGEGADSQPFSPAGENRYPPPRMVRITAGLAGSGSILRRIRMIRRSTARSNASLSRALANSSSRSRDSTRFGLAANTLSRPNSEAVSGCSLPSSSRNAWASRSSHLVPNRTKWFFAALAPVVSAAAVSSAP
jgi:hypothetical protein